MAGPLPTDPRARRFLGGAPRSIGTLARGRPVRHWRGSCPRSPLYARTVGYTFVWDDLDLVVRNTALHESGWATLLLRDFWESTGGGIGM